MAAFGVNVKLAVMDAINNNEELNRAIKLDGDLFVNDNGEVFMALYIFAQDTKSAEGEWWFLQLRSAIINRELPKPYFPVRKLLSGTVIELKVR